MDKKTLFGASGFLIIIFLLAGCTQNNSNSNPATPANPTTNPAPNQGENGMKQTVQNGDTIQVNYRGTLEDGTEFDSSLKPGRTPLEFTVGAGQMIKGFDSAVLGMKLGEEKTVTLQPKDAYGEKKTELVQAIPKEQVGELFNQIQIGQELSSPYGTATVLDKNADTATLDFNHKLAGKKLVFWIKIVKITKAS